MPLLKPMRYFLVLCALVVLATLEVCAQTTSSASQTVTFGVRRAAPVVLASAQTTAISVRDINTARTTPLKVTVGSESFSDVVPVTLIAASDRAFARAKAASASAQSFVVEPKAVEKTVVTLTE